MIKTLAALVILSSAAFAQDRPPEPPKRPQPPRPSEPRPGQPPQPPDAPPAADRYRLAVVNPEETRAWLRENEPESYRRLLQAQEEGRREDVQRMLAEAAPRMRELNELKQRDPKAYEKAMELRRMERESHELAEQARRAPPEAREAMTAKLKETLGRLFDAREEARVRELAELKRRVESLEKAVTDRKGSKDRIVERRRRELMGEKSDDEW